MKDRSFDTPSPWTLVIVIAVICCLAFTSFVKLLGRPFPVVFGIAIILLTLGFLSGIALLFFQDKKSSLLDNI